jgi:hypothetical protein
MLNLRRIARSLTGAGTLTVGLLLGSVTGAAQSSDTRWQAWLGCWEAVDSSFVGAMSQGPRICVVPASGNAAVEIVTVIGDSVALRQRIEATGEQRTTTNEGCTGWERARFSPNGARVYTRSAYTCSGDLTRTSNGVMAISDGGEWLDIQGVVAGTTTGVRVARYRPARDLSGLPEEISSALSGKVAAASDAHMIAMAPTTTADVVEASRYLDPGVVQTWLAERGEGFTLDAKKLVALEKDGVAPQVIDIMVALSYPEVFALDRSRVGGPAAENERVASGGSGRTVYIYGFDGFYSPFGYRYGYNPYRYGYGYGYGYGGWYYDRPVVIVRPPSDNDRDSHGRVVKGRGYVPGRSADRSTGSSSGGSSDVRASSGGSGSGSSGSSTKGSSGSSSGSGRTAKPRPPQ